MEFDYWKLFGIVFLATLCADATLVFGAAVLKAIALTLDRARSRSKLGTIKGRR